MRKTVKVILYCTLFFAAILGFAERGEAADALPPGYLVGDDTGLKVGTDGQYFIRHDDIKPGLTFERTITISNYSNEKSTVEIKFVMNPEDKDHTPVKSGNVDLLTAISVTMTYQGKQIYTGPIDGSGTPVANKKTDPIDLGSLETGEVRTIQAKFKVSTEYPDSAWEKVNKVDFYWLFYAKKATTSSSTTETTTTSSTTETMTSDQSGSDSSSLSSSDSGVSSSDTTTSSDKDSSQTTTSSSGKNLLGGILPQTGEGYRNMLLGIAVGILLVSVVLVIAKKRRDKN